MSSTVDLYRLPVLTGPDNYQSWSEAIQVHLLLRGVWRVVNGDYAQPIDRVIESSTSTSSTSGASGSTSTATDDAQISQEKLERRIRDWNEYDDKARGIIYSTLPRAIRHEVINTQTSKGVWEDLKGRFDTVAVIQFFEGLQTAVNTRYENCKSIQDYLTQLTNALNKLSWSLRKGESLAESIKIQFLLCNLGESWDTFLACYLNSRFDKHKTTFDEIAQILTQEEILRQT